MKLSDYLYYSDSWATIYHGDCRDILPLLEPVDLVLTDPPYGMGWNTDSTRFSGGSPFSHAKRGGGRKDWDNVKGDDKPFDPTPWIDLPKVILWGFNHFANKLPVGTTLVWIKKFEESFGVFLSDAELAWMKGGYGVYCKRDTSLLAETRERCHPTQKPVGLMEWCIKKASPIGNILDPFMGSGTTLVAAKNLNRKAIGIEIEERYCKIAVSRLKQEVFDFRKTN